MSKSPIKVKFKCCPGSPDYHTTNCPVYALHRAAWILRRMGASADQIAEASRRIGKSGITVKQVEEHFSGRDKIQ